MRICKWRRRFSREIVRFGVWDAATLVKFPSITYSQYLRRPMIPLALFGMPLELCLSKVGYKCQSISIAALPIQPRLDTPTLWIYMVAPLVTWPRWAHSWKFKRVWWLDDRAKSNRIQWFAREWRLRTTYLSVTGWCSQMTNSLDQQMKMGLSRQNQIGISSQLW